MSWKEFFKPTKWKLIIFTILEVPLLARYYMHGYSVMITCSSLPCPFIEEISTRWFYPPLVTIVIARSLIFYLISCVIIHIYYKSKFKKKRRK